MRRPDAEPVGPLSRREAVVDEVRNVSVAPGETFGPARRGFVRVSLATSAERLAFGIERLMEAIEERARAG